METVRDRHRHTLKLPPRPRIQRGLQALSMENSFLIAQIALEFIC
jgi:hypothetical protein